MKYALAALFIRKYGVFQRHEGSPLMRCYDTHLLLTSTGCTRSRNSRNNARRSRSRRAQTCNKWRLNQAQTSSSSGCAPQNFVQFFAIKMILFTWHPTGSQLPLLPRLPLLDGSAVHSGNPSVAKAAVRAECGIYHLSVCIKRDNDVIVDLSAWHGMILINEN